MHAGKVKWFDEKKGFGFISNDAGGPDVFVHFSDIQSKGYRKLVENDQVSFELQTTEKGLRAVNVNKS